MSRPSDDVFRDLLRRRLAEGEDPVAVDRIICNVFEAEAAVLITDSVGFTRKTREKGILHVLSLLLMHQDLLAPVIEAHNGKLLKREADNLFAVFDTAENAVRAARAMHQALAGYNAGVDEDRQVEICVGIGFGTVVRLSGDAFGDQVNQASKLGEDTAKGGETLLTPEAHAAVRECGWSFEERSIEAAEKLTLRYFKLLD